MAENINMTREQRAALLDRIDVLNKVKALMLLPGLCMVTMKQAAAYFEVTICFALNIEIDCNNAFLHRFSPLRLYANSKGKPLPEQIQQGRILVYPSIMMTFFSGRFFSSFLGMFRLSTPCSSFAPMSASVRVSPT